MYVDQVDFQDTIAYDQLIGFVLFCTWNMQLDWAPLMT